MKQTCVLTVLAVFVAASMASAAPVRLARTPDYHAGKIAFSYLGDIWVVNEDGSNPTRLTDNTGRDINPRFSPDGRWIAFSSNRFGNNDVFVVAAAGGKGAPPDLAHGQRRGGRLVARLGDDPLPGIARRWASSREPPRSTGSRGGRARDAAPGRLGWWGHLSADGNRLVFNRHPSTWTRKHYRGSYAADVWMADLKAKTYKPLIAGEDYNRYWPMWGPNDEIYFVGDPLPNEKAVKPGARRSARAAATSTRSRRTARASRCR